MYGHTLSLHDSLPIFHIIGHADLTGQPDDREILAIEIAGEHEIVARGLGDVVEARIGVLFEPPEGREIILDAIVVAVAEQADAKLRSEEHTSELQSLMRISYAVFCLKKNKMKY